MTKGILFKRLINYQVLNSKIHNPALRENITIKFRKGLRQIV